MENRSIMVLRMRTVAFVVLLAWPGLTVAQSLPQHRRPLPPENDATAFAALSVDPTSPWTPLANAPPGGVGVMLQLRDGRILVQSGPGNATAWNILTPDVDGSYVNGTWSSGGNLPSTYGPVYFASQALLNGRQVLIQGGEYNYGSAGGEFVTLGAIGTVTPFGAVTWTANDPPAGWTSIGDSASVTLADGRVLLGAGPAIPLVSAIFNGPNSWIATAPELNYADEAALTLLPNNKVLTVEAFSGSPCAPSGGGTELYTVTNQVTGVGTFSCGPQTPVALYGGNELGASVMMYNNKLIQFGSGAVPTAIYDVPSETWSTGPTPANGLDQADGPAALEPNGKVLAMLSGLPIYSGGSCQFVEYDPVTSTLSDTANPTHCPSDPSFVGHLMILPTGQIMFTDFGDLVEVYTPAPCAAPEKCHSGVVAGVAPTIGLLSANLKSGSTNNLLLGFQLNGLTQNNGYGDDYQGDTNYPLVRLKSVADGSLHYAFTHDDCTPQTSFCHSIAPHTFGHTEFDLPHLTHGLYDLVAVANGIPSNSIRVHVHE